MDSNFSGFRAMAQDMIRNGAKRLDPFHLLGRQVGRRRKISTAEGKPKCVEKAWIDTRLHGLTLRFKRGVDPCAVMMFNRWWDVASHINITKGRDISIPIMDDDYVDIMDGLDTGRWCSNA